MYPNLKAEMARSGITIKDVAAELNCTPRTAWAKVEDRTPVSVKEAYKIQQLFPELSIDYLFNREAQYK